MRLTATTRFLVCLGAALCIALATNPTAVQSASITEGHLRLNGVLALAPLANSTTIQANRGEHRAENRTRRTIAVVPCIVPSEVSPHQRRGPLVATIAPRANSLYPSDAQNGRSPPGNLFFG